MITKQEINEIEQNVNPTYCECCGIGVIDREYCKKCEEQGSQ